MGIARTRRWTAALSVLLVLGVSRAGADVVEVDLEVVGHTELGGAGPFGDVAVVGTTAIVATEACPVPTATVVDVKDPRRPKVVSVISLPPGTTAADVDGASLATAAFTGDLVAIALAPSPCGSTTDPGGVLHHDLTDPSAPRLLARTSGCRDCPAGPRSVSVAQRGDGRVLSLSLDGSDAVAIDELTDPARPSPLGRWTVPEAAPPAGCPGSGRPASAQLHDEGQGALVVLSDGRIHDLDLSEPATPSDTGSEHDRAGTGTFGAVMPVGQRTLAIVADGGGDGGCTGGSETRGLRLFELDREVTPREVQGVRYPSPAAPGRLVASGELVYATWHADGLRVVDLGEVRARTVAQFIPAAADVVGVALLAEHVVVTDRTSGLYVLRRPDEGGGRSSFWSDLVGLLPYLAFAGLMAASFLVPRLAMGRAPVGGGVPSPAPEGVRRRHA